MYKIKKILSALILGTMTIGLVACGQTEATNNDTAIQNNESVVDGSEVAEAIEETEIADGAEVLESETLESDGEDAVYEDETVSREIDPDKPMIALTFDDGPNTTTTSEVIDMLDKYDVVGTFFLIGSNVSMDSIGMAKKAYEQGNEIECHSYKHDYMNKMTDEEILNDIEMAIKMCVAVTGEEPKFFRPPYIAVNQAMFDNIPMTFINGVGCNDWDANVDTQTRIDKVLESACDGEIVLLHDAAGNSQTVEALDTIIPSLLEQGYQLVTVSELFEIKGITPESGRVYTNVYQTTMY